MKVLRRRCGCPSLAGGDFIVCLLVRHVQHFSLLVLIPDFTLSIRQPCGIIVARSTRPGSRYQNGSQTRARRQREEDGRAGHRLC